VRPVAAVSLVVLLVAITAWGSRLEIEPPTDGDGQQVCDEWLWLDREYMTVTVPESLYVRGRSWVVVIVAEIDTKGWATPVEVHQGDSLFVEFALERLKECRFSRPTLHGEPVVVPDWTVPFDITTERADCLIRSDQPEWGIQPDSRGLICAPEDSVILFASRAAEQFARARVGDEFFDRYIYAKWDLNSKNLFRNGPRWKRSHLEPGICRVPYGMELYHHGCEVDIDSSGRVISQSGLPDCATNPCECEFTVTEDGAVEAARLAGLAGDPDGWHVHFGWHEVHGTWTYAWRVLYVHNVVAPQSPPFRQDYVLVDANDGTVEGPAPVQGEPN